MTLKPKKSEPTRAQVQAADTTQGQLQVVVSFRMPQDSVILPSTYQRGIEQLLRSAYPVDGPMDVAVQVIGAGGEASAMEGDRRHMGLTEDVPVVRTRRDQATIDPGDKL